MMPIGVFAAFMALAVGIVSATSNGLTELVTWDKYSLMVNDTRVFMLQVLGAQH
jgi:hypothetical protein